MYFLFTLLFARYSSFYLYLLLFSLAFLSPYSAYFSVLSNFLPRFSRLAWRLLLLAFLVALSLSFQPIFTHNPFSTNLNYNKFLCRYFCFASWLEIAKYWEFLFNFNLISLISRSQRGLQIICLRGLTSTNSHAMPNHVPAVRWARGTSSLEYAHFIVIYRCLLLPTTEAGGVRTPIALHCGSSIFNLAMKAAEIGRFWLNIPLKLGRSFFLSP